MENQNPLPPHTRRIKFWPAGERPRERLIEKGAEALSDAQLIAVLLGSGGGGRSAVDLAIWLLHTFGGIRGLATAAVSELCDVKGMGPAKASQLKAAIEAGKRVASAPLGKRKKVTCSRDVYKVYQHYFPYFCDLRKEIFKIVLLDGKHQIFGDALISEGSLTASIVHPREVFAPAIRNSAAAILLLHNHPSGDPQPSAEDIEITQRLLSAGEILGIKVLDHLVIGDGTYFSFVDKGLL